MISTPSREEGAGEVLKTDGYGDLKDHNPQYNREGDYFMPTTETGYWRKAAPYSGYSADLMNQAEAMIKEDFRRWREVSWLVPNAIMYNNKIGLATEHFRLSEDGKTVYVNIDLGLLVRVTKATYDKDKDLSKPLSEIAIQGLYMNKKNGTYEINPLAKQMEGTIEGILKNYLKVVKSMGSKNGAEVIRAVFQHHNYSVDHRMIRDLKTLEGKEIDSWVMATKGGLPVFTSTITTRQGKGKDPVRILDTRSSIYLYEIMRMLFVDENEFANAIMKHSLWTILADGGIERSLQAVINHVNRLDKGESSMKVQDKEVKEPSTTLYTRQILEKEVFSKVQGRGLTEYMKLYNDFKADKEQVKEFGRSNDMLKYLTQVQNRVKLYNTDSSAVIANIPKRVEFVEGSLPDVEKLKAPQTSFNGRKDKRGKKKNGDKKEEMNTQKQPPKNNTNKAEANPNKNQDKGKNKNKKGR